TLGPPVHPGECSSDVDGPVRAGRHRQDGAVHLRDEAGVNPAGIALKGEDVVAGHLACGGGVADLCELPRHHHAVVEHGDRADYAVEDVRGPVHRVGADDTG